MHTQERGSSGEDRGGSNVIIERRNKRRASGGSHGAPRPDRVCGACAADDIGSAEPAPQKQVAPLAGRQLRPRLPRRQAPCCCHLLLAGNSLAQTCPSRHALQLDGTPPPREARLPGDLVEWAGRRLLLVRRCKICSRLMCHSQRVHGVRPLSAWPALMRAQRHVRLPHSPGTRVARLKIAAQWPRAEAGKAWGAHCSCWR